MIKPDRKECTFRLSRENRIMLLDIMARSSRIGQAFNENEIINSALKDFLPALLSRLEKIGMDEDLVLLREHIRMLEEESQTKQGRSEL